MSVKRLSLEDVADNINLVSNDTFLVEDGYINAEFETWFDVDAVFGTDTRDDDEVWINFYANYYPETEEVKAFFIIDRPDGNEERFYKLNDKERELLKNLMEEGAIKEGYVSLDDMYDRITQEYDRITQDHDAILDDMIRDML